MADIKNAHSFQVKFVIILTGIKDSKPAGRIVRNTILYQPVKIEAG